MHDFEARNPHQASDRTTVATRMVQTVTAGANTAVTVLLHKLRD